MTTLTTHNIDWDDPAARARLIEQIGPDAYNAAAEQHRRESVVASAGGNDIRPVQSRFGTLFMVGDTGMAFSTRNEAEDYARKNPTAAFVDSVAVEAEQEFWSFVARRFPDIKSGDLDAGDAARFSNLCRLVVGDWIDTNSDDSGYVIQEQSLL